MITRGLQRGLDGLGAVEVVVELAQRVRFALADHVAQAHLGGIEAEGARDDVDVRLHGEDGLGLAGAAHVSGGDLVGVDVVCAHAGVGDAVGAYGVARARQEAERHERRVGARVEVALDVAGHDGAVALDAGRDADLGWVARIAGRELLGVVHDHLDGPAGGLREEVAQRYVHRRALAAEVAADGHVVDAHHRLGDARAVGDLLPDVVRRLVRRPDLHAAVGRRLHQAGVRLHVRLVDDRRRIGALDDELRGSRCGFGVALAPGGRDEEVGGLVLRLDAGVVVEARVQQQRAGLDGLSHVEDGGQRLVVDDDEGERAVGRLRIDGGDGGDRLADEPHDLAREHRHVQDAAAGHGPGEVGSGDDGVDAGELGGRRGVDAADARVRVRAAEHAAVEHAARAGVRGVARGARHLLAAIGAGGRAADGLACGHGGASVAHGRRSRLPRLLLERWHPQPFRPSPRPPSSPGRG